MAISGTSKQGDRLEGLTPLRAKGVVSCTPGILTTLATDTLTVHDSNVDSKTLIFANVISGPAGVAVVKAVATSRTITFTLCNVAGGSSASSAMTIGYIGV